ncbi:MAG TPA: cytidine deaminase [Longimicrobiales bacterium]|nr:cytidine deaminase [Longimicrobiales bacterium]
MERLRYQDLTAQDRELVDAARDACETAYAPYSGVAVGAALRTGSGIVTGSNVENAAYGATVCAERMAVGRANARGDRRFTAVAVAARGAALRPDQVISPCGTCRQVLYEISATTGADARVLMAAPETDAVTIATVAELLPLPFNALSR